MKKLFFALITSFLFVATAWGQCTLDVTPNGKEYSLGESGSSIFYVPEEGYNSVTLQLSKEALAAGKTEVILYNNGFTQIGSEEIAASKLSSSSYKSFTISTSGDNVRYIRVLNDGTLYKYVRNIVVRRADNTLTSTSNVNFDSRSVGVDVVKSINLYSNNGGNLTIKLKNDDGVFSVDKTLIPSCGCNEIVNIKFSPKAYTTYTNELQIINSNGVTKTISLTGVCSATELPQTEASNYVEYNYVRETSFTASTRGALEYYFSANKAPINKNINNVSFEAKADNGLLSTIGNPDMYINAYEYGNSNFNEDKYWKGKGNIEENNYKKFVATIPDDMVALRFETGLANGRYSRYVKNLQVYSTTILNKNIEKIDFGQVEIGKSSEKSFILTFANAKTLLADIKYNNPVTASYAENGQSFYKVEFLQNDVKAEGTQTVKVTFTPSSCVENYDATLTFYNGKTVTINLTGARVRNSGTVSEITWTGNVDTNWDNRANWKKADGNVLSAADVLSENLLVILPAGKDRYPVLPDVSTYEAFKTVRDKECNCAQVNAGDNETATMIADKIYMESGAALVGVETLNKGTSRYREVEMEFTPKRYNEITNGYDWSLVGPVVKPWDDENPGQTRDVISRDYYLNDLPHVYMHEAKVNDDYEISWDESFPNLDVELPNNKAFAIRLPNQYGRNDKGKGLPAVVYNRRNETSYNPTDLITFHFKGRFYNEAELPKYTGLETGKPVLLNNTYPANINAYELQKGNGTIVYYDYDNKSFVPVGDNKDAVIMSQHGFIFTASNDGDLIVSQSCMQNTATGERSAEEEIQGLRLQIANEDKALASEIFVRYDFLKEDNVDYDFDSPKVFNKMEPELPDIYAIRYNSKWAGLTVPTLEKQIPLGIKVSASNQVFTISLKNSNLPYDILLEDRSTGDVYNLSEGEKCVVEGLGINDYEGRFYLGTSESDISTDIEEKVEESATIDVFTRGKTIVVSADAGVELDYVELVDMSGSKEIYELEGGHYEEIPAIVPTGIYVVKVVTDKTSVVTKVKLN